MKRLLLICIGFLIVTMTSYAADSLMVAQGEEIFKQNCKACHHLQMRLVGPALKGVKDRHPEEWIYKFITSSQSMVQAGDSAAVQLFNTYNQVIMPDQKLSRDEISSVLAYVESAGSSPGSSSGIKRPLEAPGPKVVPLRFSDFRFWIIYTITVVLVIVAIYYKAELIALRKQVQPELD